VEPPGRLTPARKEPGDRSQRRRANLNEEFKVDDQVSNIVAEEPQRPQPFWTPERDALLRQLWDEHLPCKLIAEQLGGTKNQVLGRAHRIGLPIHKHALLGRQVGKPRLRPPVSPASTEPLARAERRWLLDPRVDSAGKCRWIEGPTRGPQTVFCADPAVPGKSWCARCMERLYAPRGGNVQRAA